MKFLILFSFLSVLLLKVKCDMEQQKALLRGIALECKVNEDASDEDLSRLVSKKPPETKEGKCLMACILEQMGVIDDGKLSVSGFLEFAKDAVDDDPGKMKIANELSKDCGGIKHSDRCELAYMACGCIKMGGMKKNIDFGF
jgi:hypothetical protein